MRHVSKAFKLLAVCAAAVAMSIGSAGAQDSKSFKPVDGMDGKDVTWVGTDQIAVNQMLDMASVTDKDYVIDLGSGDGRMVIMAAKRGAQGLGIEYNPKLVEFSKLRAEKEGVSKRAEFIKADIFKSDFSKATVLMMYLLPELNRKLRPKILAMKPGTRVTSIAFDMGAWKADHTQRVKACDMADGCTAYLWIVPARAAGRWKLDDGTLTLKQNFQNLSGTYLVKGKRQKVANAKLDGAKITFAIGGKTYEGLVDGDKMSGTIAPAKDSKEAAKTWTAEKFNAKGKRS